MCVGYFGRTRSRLTVVGGMAFGSPWTGVNLSKPSGFFTYHQV